MKSDCRTLIILARNQQIVSPESAMLTFITSSEISNYSIRPIYSIRLSYFSMIHDVTLFIDGII